MESQLSRLLGQPHGFDQRSEEWHAYRCYRFTGSRIPSLYGFFCRSYKSRGKYSDRFARELEAEHETIFARMVGDEAAPPVGYAAERMQFGINMERRAVQNLYSYLLQSTPGVRFEYPPFLIDPDYPHFACSPDALVFYPSGRVDVAEAKAALGRPYTSSKPYHYFQMLWNLGIARKIFGAKNTNVVWFTGYGSRCDPETGSNSYVEAFEYDDEKFRAMCSYMNRIAEKFLKWAKLVGREVPPWFVESVARFKAVHEAVPV